MNGFILAPKFNTPGDNDATGAFHIGARWFARVHSVPTPPVFFNNQGSPAEVAGRVRKHLEEAPPGWDVFVYFGHGDNTCLPSAHFYGRYGAKVLADAIRARANPGVTVLLYACNTGVKGGFAEWLSEGLEGLDATVFAHTPPPAHTFTCPHVVRYPGGDMVIGRHDPLWRDWVNDLSETNDLWARFPFMTEDELRAELAAPEYLLGRWKVGDKGGTHDVVFFGDQTVVQTDDNRYGVVARGTWSATGHRLTVTWDGGATEVWPLPLSLKGQNVRLVEDGKLRMLKATRTEPIEINPSVMFLSAAARAQLIDI
jgi:hypothetical protein